MSREKDQAYFCEGIAEEIINALCRVQGLRVASRTGSFQFKDSTADLARDRPNKLRVEAILEGSVRKSENRLRITVQLIEAARGFHLWSESYDRELRDIFAIQQEIARSVVQRPPGHAQPPGEGRPGRGPHARCPGLRLLPEGPELLLPLRPARHRIRPPALLPGDRARPGIRPGPRRPRRLLVLHLSLLRTEGRRPPAGRKRPVAGPSSSPPNPPRPRPPSPWPCRSAAAKRKRRARVREGHPSSIPSCSKPGTSTPATPSPAATCPRRPRSTRRPCGSGPKTSTPLCSSGPFYDRLGRHGGRAGRPRARASPSSRRTSTSTPTTPGPSTWAPSGSSPWERRTRAATGPGGPARSTPTIRCFSTTWDASIRWPATIEEAIDCLERAAAGGLLQKGWYENDGDLDALRSHPRFRALLERM